MSISDAAAGRPDASSVDEIGGLLAVDLHSIDDSARLLDLSLRLQGALRACADAEEQLQRLGRSLTHDLRAPVRQFASFVGLLDREQVTVSPRAQTYMDHIATSTVTLTEKIDALAQMLRERRESVADKMEGAASGWARSPEPMAIDGAP